MLSLVLNDSFFEISLPILIDIQLGGKKTHTPPSKNSYNNSYKGMSFFATKLYLPPWPVLNEGGYHSVFVNRFTKRFKKASCITLLMEEGNLSIYVWTSISVIMYFFLSHWFNLKWSHKVRAYEMKWHRWL